MESVFGFTGEHRDVVSGGYPLGHGYRWYLPALMRFNAPDSWSPFGWGGVHPYAYCGCDPLHHGDPSGHMMGEFDFMRPYETNEEISLRLERRQYGNRQEPPYAGGAESRSSTPISVADSEPPSPGGLRTPTHIGSPIGSPGPSSVYGGSPPPSPIVFPAPPPIDALPSTSALVQPGAGGAATADVGDWNDLMTRARARPLPADQKEVFGLITNVVAELNAIGRTAPQVRNYPGLQAFSLQLGYTQNTIGSIVLRTFTNRTASQEVKDRAVRTLDAFDAWPPNSRAVYLNGLLP